jgi:hypothetical protein
MRPRNKLMEGNGRDFVASNDIYLDIEAEVHITVSLECITTLTSFGQKNCSLECVHDPSHTLNAGPKTARSIIADDSRLDSSDCGSEARMEQGWTIEEGLQAQTFEVLLLDHALSSVD